MLPPGCSLGTLLGSGHCQLVPIKLEAHLKTEAVSLSLSMCQIAGLRQRATSGRWEHSEAMLPGAVQLQRGCILSAPVPQEERGNLHSQQGECAVALKGNGRQDGPCKQMQSAAVDVWAHKLLRSLSNATLGNSLGCCCFHMLIFQS